jgi:hypothetical protein
VTTVSERSTANRPVQATALGASVQFGPLGSGHQRPPIRLQRLGWTDPNLHRFPQREPSESAHGSPANDLLIDQTRVTLGFSEPVPGGRTSGIHGVLANLRHGGAALRRAREGSLAPRPRAAMCCVGPLQGPVTKGRLPPRRGCLLPAGPAASDRASSRDDERSRACCPRGPPRRSRLDRLAFSWKAPRRGRPRVAADAAVNGPRVRRGSFTAASRKAKTA